MIGVSSYFHDLNLDYLKQAAEYGITHVFTSLVILEEDYGDLDEKLAQLLEIAKEYHLTIIPDISPVTLRKLNIQNIEDIDQLGFKAVRIDGGFNTIEESKRLIEKFEVYLNASDVKPEFIQELHQAGCDLTKVSVLHNFYPKVNTGLNKEHMIHINKQLKELGLKVAAFVPGNTRLRGPLFEGLPTLEKHRGISPYVACVELLDCDVDDVYIGDCETSIDDLSMMINYQNDSILSLKVILDDEYKDLYNKDIPIRRDLTDHLIRLSYGRGVYKDIKQKNCYSRFIGAITIDNNLSGRYLGEINICKDSLPSDAKANVIGFIYPEHLQLLNAIKRDTIIRFVK